MTIKNYIDNINRRYQQGNATEHTFRGDLQQMLETLKADMAAINILIQNLIYTETPDQPTLDQPTERTPSQIPKIVKHIEKELGLTFVPEKNDLTSSATRGVMSVSPTITMS